MPASEFKEWLMLEAEEPFGDRRADYHAALIAFSAAKHAGNKKSTFKDFLMFRKPAAQDGEEEDESSIKAVAAQVQDAFLKATANLKKRVIHKRKK